MAKLAVFLWIIVTAAWSVQGATLKENDTNGVQKFEPLGAEVLQSCPSDCDYCSDGVCYYYEDLLLV